MRYYRSTSGTTWITFTCSAPNWRSNMVRSTVVERGWLDSRNNCHMRKWRDRGGEAIHVLSIDFDYWYLGDGNPDYHCGYCEHGDEFSRAVGTTDIKRPDPLSIEQRPERDIGRRMVIRRVAPKTPIYVTECHAAITDRLVKLREENPDAHVCVWNIDEHEDVWGYSSAPDICHCGGWVDFSGEKGWLDEYWWVTDYQHLLQLPEDPKEVFVCLSSPYTSENGDRPFITFVRNLERRSGRRAKVFGYASKAIKQALTERRRNDDERSSARQDRRAHG